MTLVNTLRQQLADELVDNQQTIVVAYSGGIDSHVLLHTLFTLRQQGKITNPLSAIHIHHGLSANADKWLAHCQAVCAELDIAFQAGKVNLQTRHGQSLEALARDARYHKLVELAPAQSVVLLAQHRDDQLETVLLQLKRGAGPKGLAAMAQRFSQQSGEDQSKQVHFLRPLLALSQSQIEDYAQQHQLTWVEDESNQSEDFERNFLLLKVLPLLTDKWPDLAKSVSRSAQLCAEQQLLLDDISGQKLTELKVSKNSLDLEPLRHLSTAWLHQIIRAWLEELSIARPSLAVLQRLKPELIEAQADATPIIQWGQWQFRRFAQQIFVIAIDQPIEPHSWLWQGQTQIELPQALGTLQAIPTSGSSHKDGLLLNPASGPISFHFGGFSQRFTPQNSSHSKPLKQWYKKWQIPPWQRDKILAVSQNDTVVGLLQGGQWLQSKKGLSQIDEDLSGQVLCLSFIFKSDKL